MHRRFTVGEIESDAIADSLWDAPPEIPAEAVPGGSVTRSSSEFFFQRFIAEIPELPSPPAPIPVFGGRVLGLGGVGESAVRVSPRSVDQIALKQKLEMELAAAAASGGFGAVQVQPRIPVDANERAPKSAKMSSQGVAGGTYSGGCILVQSTFTAGQSEIQAHCDMKHTAVQTKQMTSSSSVEPLSDDDDQEEETVMDALSVQKLNRRKESNRESARRSRTRRAAQVKELEEQVKDLTSRKVSRLTTLTTLQEKYNNAAVDNRVLKAEIETIRTKVQMAEDNLRRLTGNYMHFSAAPDLSSGSMPFTGSPSDANSDVGIPFGADLEQLLGTGINEGITGYISDIASSPVDSLNSGLIDERVDGNHGV